jgi:histidyl-tRNA synthetase
MMVEAELIAAVSKILLRLRQNDAKANFDDFVVLANHRLILYGALEKFDIPTEKHNDVLVAIDKGDKIGWPGVLEELVQKDTLNESHAREFVEALFFDPMVVGDSPDNRTDAEKLTDQNAEDFEKFEQLIGNTKSGAVGLRAMREFFELSKDLPSSGYIRFQPSLARGLSYYTGSIFEIGLNRLDFKGSIGGGGRYDGLIGMFGKEQIPACGFSLGLERILVVMDERGMFPPEIAESTPADVMVTIWNEETIADSLKLATELRSQGLRVTLYPEPDKLGKQFKYADQINVPFVCILGESEIAEGKVTLKNLESGKQSTIDRSDVSKEVGRV